MDRSTKRRQIREFALLAALNGGHAYFLRRDDKKG
jgi:hypothetical protein